jgi:hypothetical protein
LHGHPSAPTSYNDAVVPTALDRRCDQDTTSAAAAPDPRCVGCGELLDLRFAFCDATCEDRWRRARGEVLGDLTFTRPSHHDNVEHVIHVERDSLTLVDVEIPCTCAAGSKGVLCWAVLEVLAIECVELACGRVINAGRLYGPLSEQRQAAETLLNAVFSRWQLALRLASQRKRLSRVWSVTG